MPKPVKRSGQPESLGGFTMTVVVGCPVCGKAICHHCWECRADLSSEHHRAGCSDDPGYRCTECLDTRLTRTGGPCPHCPPTGGRAAR